MMKKNHRSVIIVGTDTGVGKTLITGLLAGYLRDHKINAMTQKFVQTGGDKNCDLDQHDALMRIEKNKVNKWRNLRMPYCFKLAASPHLAAAAENKKISLNKLHESLVQLDNEFESVIAETSGGVLVPLSKNDLMIDQIKQAKLPVIVVAANRLGAINHTLLTIQALRQDKIKILGIVFNRLKKNADDKVCKDNLKIISDLTKIKVFGELDFSKNPVILRNKFKPIGKKIYDEIKKYG